VEYLINGVSRFKRISKAFTQIVTFDHQIIQMRILILLLIIAYSFNISTGCKSASKEKTFCDTACLKDSIKFTGDHKLAPYVYISASTCIADTLTWSYNGMGVNRKVSLAEFLNHPVHINKDYIKCIFKDTAYAWLLFNDCATGRGYQLKLPFNKTANIGRKGGGINSTDPKFNVADNLVAYSDRGNLFVEEISTGKKAEMTFGEDLGIDFDYIHDYIDSVNITPTRIWARFKAENGKEWQTKEKTITLE
jgi:hypothetical protein